MHLSFRRGPSTLIKLALLLIITLTLLVVDHRFRAADPVRAGLATVVAPLQYIVTLPAELLGLSGETFRSHTELLEENRQLKKERMLLEARLQKLWALKTENDRLRSLLNASRQVEEQVLIAEIIGVDLDPFRQQVVINKGTPDGVFDGQAVLDAEGVIGQVVEASPLSANVMLVSDPSHAVPVRVARNGLRSVAFGTGKVDDLNLRYIPNSADIREGDTIVTSGLGGRFPSDYPVGRVTEVTIQPGRPFARVRARPLAELNRVQEVLLVQKGEKSGAEKPATESPGEAGEQESAGKPAE